MSKEVTVISPESLEIANKYLMYGNIEAVSSDTGITQDLIVAQLNKTEVKRYIDNVYLDLGYRNKNNIANVMDTIIKAKLEEAEETGMYSTKDIADLMMMAHKMRMDEIKLQAELEKNTEVKKQTNIQNNFMGEGNYGKLMEKLLNGVVSEG